MAVPRAMSFPLPLGAVSRASLETHSLKCEHDLCSQTLGAKVAVAASRPPIGKGLPGSFLGDKSENIVLVDIHSDQIMFSSSHFVAQHGFRERLHGHNYLAGIGLSAPRNAGNLKDVNWDFLKDSLKRSCAELNDRFIVPILSEVMKIRVNPIDEDLRIICEDGARFSIPLMDCILLPITKSTCDEIARYLHGVVASELALHAPGLRIDLAGLWMKIIVFERPQDWATYSLGVAESAAIARSAAGKAHDRASL
eukprot:TRINITY_DN37648_c0_g1_i1.p1 TRINITY_DN37648_c0_g1~~TRINITY_DN37648_c0_g1_i1.p1  ORF type:complete len:253 (+),score=25.59 TRINITY_DN37648_c0_g1_i1:58-816(+)